MTDPYRTILLAVDDAGVATLTLDRPEALNAWHDEMARALAHAREFRLAAPASVVLSKRLLWEGLGLTAAEMMKREGPLIARAVRQADAREDVLSFLEKREPAWKLRPSVDLPER